MGNCGVPEMEFNMSPHDFTASGQWKGLHLIGVQASCCCRSTLAAWLLSTHGQWIDLLLHKGVLFKDHLQVLVIGQV